MPQWVICSDMKSAHVRFFEAHMPKEKQFWGNKGGNSDAESSISAETLEDTVSEGEQRGLGGVTPVITTPEPFSSPMPLANEPKSSKIQVLLPKNIPNDTEYQDYREFEGMDLDNAASYATCYTGKAEISHWVYSIVLEAKNRILDEEPNRAILASVSSSTGCYHTAIPGVDVKRSLVGEVL
jgi:hypothetical protein